MWAEETFFVFLFYFILKLKLIKIPEVTKRNQKINPHAKYFWFLEVGVTEGNQQKRRKKRGSHRGTFSSEGMPLLVSVPWFSRLSISPPPTFGGIDYSEADRRNGKQIITSAVGKYVAATYQHNQQQIPGHAWVPAVRLCEGNLLTAP